MVVRRDPDAAAPAPGRRPYVVLPPGSDLDAAAREVGQRGWRVHRGFFPPAAPWDLAPARVVAVGAVDAAADARAALLCAVRGAGLVAVIDRDRPWAASFLADLARLGAPNPPPPGPAAAPAEHAAAGHATAGQPEAVQPAPDGPARPAGPDPLTSEQRDLLDLLADGHSIAQAAKLRYLSLRTANRRVAEARTALGVATTREAVLAYRRLRGG